MRLPSETAKGNRIVSLCDCIGRSRTATSKTPLRGGQGPLIYHGAAGGSCRDNGTSDGSISRMNGPLLPLWQNEVEVGSLESTPSFAWRLCKSDVSVHGDLPLFLKP